MTTPLRLLLIEDSEEDAELVVTALTRAGHQVTAERVDTAQTLQAALTRQSWDIAIADFTMPGFSGTAALKMLREHDADLPFIFVSGTIGEDAAVDGMRTGAHDYIIKGHLKRLVPAVERELREAAVRRERTRAEQRLAHLAFHDPLTDLPNRMRLRDRLHQAILTAERDRKPLTLLVMDLDGFKDINDGIGHHAGDQVLQQVASRLRGLLREADTVARLGGDEFSMILPFTDLQAAELMARTILSQLDRPFVVEGRPLVVHASIGIAKYPEHGTTAETLLQKADAAMYIAKSDRSACAIYAPDRDLRTHRRLTLVAELRRGLDEEQFDVDYQPIVHLGTGDVFGVEALVRWEHPFNGRMLPGDFIDLAEQSGLVNPLTMFVLNRALRDWAGQGGPRPVRVSVNLSPRNLHDPHLPERVRDMVRAHGMPTSALALEITESVIMSDPVRSTACLTRLRDMGVRLVIDDFGTGYSSLTYLRRLPVDELKIDKSFILGLEGPDGDEIIVRSTIELAHDLGLTVVAEGVESESLCHRLRLLGCDAAQGLFIGGPKSAADTRAWLARRDATRRP